MLSKQDNEILTRVGPGTPMGNLLRRFWIPALLEEEIMEPDGAPLKLRLLGENLIAFRNTVGKVGIVEAYCAHRRAPLFLGRNEENGIRCVYHGWKFDVDGQCVDLPTAGDEAHKEKIKITAYPTAEHGGVIWVYMGPRDVMPKLPDFEWTRLPKMQRTSTKRLQRSNWAQVVEGGIDSAHVSFLHRSKPEEPSINARTNKGDKTVIQESIPDKYLMMDGKPVFDVKEVDHGLMISARRNAEADHYYWRINQFLLPFYTIIPPHLSNMFKDSSQASYYGHVYVPIDDENTWNWSFTASPHAEYSQEEWSFQGGKAGFWGPVDDNYLPLFDDANDYLINRDKQRTDNFTGIEGIPNQDAAVQEGMGPIVDRTKEHLVTSDRGVMQFRRLMLRLAKNLMNGEEPKAAVDSEIFNVRSVTCVLPASVPIWEGAKDLFRGTAPANPDSN